MKPEQRRVEDLLHELLDRTHVVSEMFDTHIRNHIISDFDHETHQLINKISDNLYELYQRIGSLEPIHSIEPNTAGSHVGVISKVGDKFWVDFKYLDCNNTARKHILAHPTMGYTHSSLKHESVVLFTIVADEPYTCMGSIENIYANIYEIL